jgi:hypothetical protein
MEDFFAALEPYRWIHGSIRANELPNRAAGFIGKIARRGAFAIL